MLGIGCPDRHALPRVNLVEICRERRVLPSRASGFVLRRIMVVRAPAEDRPLSTTKPTARGRFKASDFHRLGGEAFGGEWLVLWRFPGIPWRRGAFFRDLGEQPGLDRGTGPLLLRLIVGETAGLEDDRAQLAYAAATSVVEMHKRKARSGHRLPPEQA